MEKRELSALFAEKFPFWDKMHENDKETFCRTSQSVKFEKGTNIHNGNECTGVILVKSGSLRLYMLSEEGKEIFVHYTGIVAEGFRALTEGQNVEFEIGSNEKGQQAVNVTVIKK